MKHVFLKSHLWLHKTIIILLFHLHAAYPGSRGPKKRGEREGEREGRREGPLLPSLSPFSLSLSFSAFLRASGTRVHTVQSERNKCNTRIIILLLKWYKLPRPSLWLTGSTCWFVKHPQDVFFTTRILSSLRPTKYTENAITTVRHRSPAPWTIVLTLNWYKLVRPTLEGTMTQRTHTKYTH